VHRRFWLTEKDPDSIEEATKKAIGKSAIDGAHQVGRDWKK
jgi:hypothetical protein